MVKKEVVINMFSVHGDLHIFSFSSSCLSWVGVQAAILEEVFLEVESALENHETFPNRYVLNLLQYVSDTFIFFYVCHSSFPWELFV